MVLGFLKLCCFILLVVDFLIMFCRKFLINNVNLSVFVFIILNVFRILSLDLVCLSVLFNFMMI